MQTVQWALALKDSVSPSGKKIAGTFATIGNAAQKLGGKGLSVATKGIQSLGKKVTEALPAIAKWTAIAGVAAGVGLAAAGIKLTADAMSFKDSTLIATSALLKSNALAGSAYKRMLDFANYFGQDPTEAMARFNHALATGFSAGDAEKLMQSFGDLKLVTPNVNADSLLDAFGTIRKKGILELSDFQGAVSSAGLNLTLAYEAIGKKLGKNAKEVEALIGSGRVRADVGLIGLLDAINQRTNSSKAGEKLAEYANTTSGLVARLKNLPNQFIMRMDMDDSPMKGALSKLLGQLDPNGPNGKKIIAALSTTFAKIGDVLSTWATPEGIEKLTKGITGVVEAAPKVLKAIGMIAGAVVFVGGAFTGLRDDARFLWSELKSGSAIVSSLGMAVTAIAAPMVSMALGVWRWGNVAVDGLKWIGKTVVDLGTKAIDWGKNIVAGMWAGILAGWADLKKGWNDLIKSLPKKVATTLEIHSPSRVMARLGQHTVAGFGMGVEQGAPSMTQQLVDAIDGGRSAAAGAVRNVTSSTSSSSRTSKSVVVNVGGISVETNAKDGRGMGRDIARELERSFDWAGLA